MPPRSRRVLFFLAASFIVSGASFVLSTVISQNGEQGIVSDSVSIAENAAPSVVHLGNLRTLLRKYELEIDDATDRPDASVDLPVMTAELRREWIEYTRLPTYPNERELQPAAARDLDAVIAAIEQMRQRPSAMQSLLEHELKPACDALDHSLGQLDEVNALAVSELGAQIAMRRRRSRSWAVALTAVSGLLQLLSALVAIGLVRARTRALERRADELDSFAGRIAHDVMGPLSVINLRLALLDRGEDLPANTGRIRNAVSRVRILVDGLLAFARSGAGPETGICRPGEVLPALLDDLKTEAAEERIELRCEPIPDVKVHCAEGVLISIVSNLARNAIRHMGGREPRWIRLGFRAADGRLRLEVEDTGPGIPEELAPRIFDPFVRGSTAVDGVGLGLATVKRLVTAHEGTIGFASRAGSGTTFIVELPV